MEYPIEIIKEKTSREYLNKFLDKPFKEVVKFVIDIEKEILAVGGELHADAMDLLIAHNSKSANLWGGNFYPLRKNNWIEYTSLINLKPNQNHFFMDIQNKTIIKKINRIIEKLINA